VNYASVEGIAKTLLYEGYLLYPYRPSSLKNARRFTFGSLYPRAYAERGRERSEIVAEVLVEGRAPALGARAVFLVACERTLGDARRVEVVERRIDVEPNRASELALPRRRHFEAHGETWFDGKARFSTRPLEGVLELRTEPVAPGVTKFCIRFENVADVSAALSSEDAELVAFGSAHLMLAVDDGKFVSLIEPPPALADAARACRNDGVWPVLVGDAARRDRMLASPIVVYDFPAHATESHGDYFDATEIDEMLALRLRTLTDAEKREVYAGDPRAAALLSRTEALEPRDLSALHGARRDSVPRPGDRVRLRPRPGRDAIDVLLRGELATVISLESDFEGRTYCTVALDADPGRDLAEAGEPGHRFFYEPDELERVP
jgi:hydrogenase maturation protease